VVLLAASLLVGLVLIRLRVSRANLTLHLCVRCGLLILTLVGVAYLYLPDNQIGPYLADSLIVTLPLLVIDLSVTHLRRLNDSGTQFTDQ
jgi:hypothetical protein